MEPVAVVRMDNEYRVTAVKETKVGEWYWGANCQSCKRQFGVIPSGSTPVKFEGPGHWLVSCPRCSHMNHLGTSEISNFQYRPPH